MAFNFNDLDATTRALMQDEILADVAKRRLYVSLRLNATGQTQWLELLCEAVVNHDEAWLADQLRQLQLLNTIETRTDHKTGHVFQAKIPRNAHEVLAEGEFNRYYVRGICRKAQQSNYVFVRVYRAKIVVHPRPESQALIGHEFNASGLLNDLQSNPAIALERVFALPAGPNTGLSVEIVKNANAG
jgi:hypothetical protein